MLQLRDFFSVLGSQCAKDPERQRSKQTWNHVVWRLLATLQNRMQGSQKSKDGGGGGGGESNRQLGALKGRHSLTLEKLALRAGRDQF